MTAAFEMVEVLAQAFYVVGIKGVGYGILRAFALPAKRNIDFDGVPVVVTGVLAWAIILAVVIFYFNRNGVS